MGEFFKGWRRKAGLVTLAMATLLSCSYIFNAEVKSLDGILTIHTMSTGESRNVSWSVPYWAIVVPLTLLSAWLILGKTKSVP